jgi:biopolymer transport protein ExbD
MAPAEVGEALQRLRGEGDVTVEILADEKVPYGTVAKVMAQIQRAGISKFTFVMLPEETSRHP